jgi:hypothetical protein
MQKVWARWGISSTDRGRSLSQAEYVAEIDAKRPFYVSKIWGTPSNILGGHALLAYGYNGMYIDYWDPARIVDGGGTKSLLYTSLLSSPTATPSFFWGDSITNIRRTDSTQWGTWYVTDIMPTPSDSVGNPGWVKVGGTFNTYNADNGLAIDYGTTTSYEKYPVYSGFGSFDVNHYGSIGWFEAYLQIPVEDANKTMHFRVRQLYPYSYNTKYTGADQTFSCLSPNFTNGVCGSANGSLSTVAPTSNLCSIGNASPVSGSGPWSWTCYGANGGSNATCSTQVGQLLTVTLSGTGAGSVTPGGGSLTWSGITGTGTYSYGTLVTLTATPAPGNIFTGWKGECTGMGSCVLTMNANKSVSASFTPDISSILNFLLNE